MKDYLKVAFCLKISWKSSWESAEHKRLSVDLRNGMIIKQNLWQSFTSLFWFFDLNTSYLHYHCCNRINKSPVTELQTKGLLKHRKFLLTDAQELSLIAIFHVLFHVDSRYFVEEKTVGLVYRINKSPVTELQTKGLLKHRKFLLTDAQELSLIAIFHVLFHVDSRYFVEEKTVGLV